MKRALFGVVIGIVVLGVYFPIIWWITGIAVLLIVVLFVGLEMIDNIYKKNCSFFDKDSYRKD